jgi:predicted anti-sigma-YlaC factor YlaD
MKAVVCTRENELLDALARRFVDGELEAHIASCLSCSELRTVAAALLDERANAIRQAPVPSAGTMWWRVQMRHRHEAQAAARRSLLIGQGMTLAIATILMVALLGGEVTAGIREVIASIRFSVPLQIALVTSLLLAPIAGFVALRERPERAGQTKSR